MAIQHLGGKALFFGLGFCLALVCCLVVVNFATGEKEIGRHVERMYALDDPQFARELGVLLGPPFVQGNSAMALLNGDEIFPPMLQAIRDAKESITFETYIYWSGEIGKEFTAALSERAKAGIPVNVIIDWAGSIKMDDELLDQMRNSGVRIHRYRPLHWYTLGRINNRTLSLIHI